jgi:hypothetical protein
MQNYMRNERDVRDVRNEEQKGREEQISWRESDNIPPATLFVSTPYDPEAHYAKKRSTSWTGYTVHLTESCDDEAPHLMEVSDSRPLGGVNAIVRLSFHKIVPRKTDEVPSLLFSNNHSTLQENLPWL